MKLVDKAEAEKGVLCKHYKGKALYAGLQHLYAEIHREMNETLLWEHAKSNEEFHEQRDERGMPQIEKASKQREPTITWYTEPEDNAAGSDAELLSPLKNT
jgi:hypothetical protein